MQEERKNIGEEHGVDRKIMTKKRFYKKDYETPWKRNNNIFDETSPKNKNTNTNERLPLSSILFYLSNSYQTSVHSTTTRHTQMKMPSHGESSSTSSHDSMHWSACYDDGCHTHRSDKEGSGYWPRQPRRQQPHRQVRKVRWGEPAPENEHNEAREWRTDLQQEMKKMAEEMGRLKEENRGLKKRVVLAEETARKAGIEARRRAYEKVELQIRIRRAMAEAEALVKDIDRDDEYAVAVGLPPNDKTPSESQTNGTNVGEQKEEENVTSEW
jgi:hypothetical protein